MLMLIGRINVNNQATVGEMLETAITQILLVISVAWVVVGAWKYFIAN